MFLFLSFNTSFLLDFHRNKLVLVGSLKNFKYLFFSKIVVTIFCLGFIYSLPRFFEYKTEVRRERLAIYSLDANYTEYVDYLVITNKLLNNLIYQYIVHLSKIRFLIIFLKYIYIHCSTL